MIQLYNSEPQSIHRPRQKMIQQKAELETINWFEIVGEVWNFSFTITTLNFYAD